MQKQADPFVFGSFNFPGGEPPTPTRTPTSPNFFLNSFETPKPDTKFNEQSSPWTPAFGHTQAFKTPTRPSFTTVSHENQTAVVPSKTTAAKNVKTAIEEDPRRRSNFGLSSPPVKVRKRSQGLSDTTASKTISQARVVGGCVSPSGIVNGGNSKETTSSAASMQTPPPTSTSSSRRKVQEAQIARSFKESTSANEKNMSSPSFTHTNNTSNAFPQVEESPLHFQNLQFSPDGFTFPASGPATAPVYPQHKLFWDPEQNIDPMSMDLSMDDSFTDVGLGLQRQLQPFMSEHTLSAGNQLSHHLAQENESSGNLNIADFSTPRHSMALNQTNISPSTAIMTQGSSRGKFAATAVNPSLLFSSPNRPSRSSNQTVQDDVLKPYAHQLQDAEIEKELRNKKTKRKRGVEVESPAVKAATLALREAEEESSQYSSDGVVPGTLGGPVRPPSQHSRRSHRHSKNSLIRKSSQHKRNGSDPLRQQSKRASITLSIDASGRASTQTSFVDDRTNDRPKSRMEVDSESESSVTTASSDSTEIVFSQPSSFTYPIDRKKRPKSTHFLPGSSSHSQKSSYSSNFSSNRKESLSTPSETSHLPINRRVAREGQAQVHFNPEASFIGGLLRPDESEVETGVNTQDDDGNAQTELKKVLLRRSSHKSSNEHQASTQRRNFAESRPLQTNTGPLHDPFSNYMSTTPSRLSISEAPKNISPTTITDPDLATPSTGQNSAGSNGTTRCICNGTESDGQLMVQW